MSLAASSRRSAATEEPADLSPAPALAPWLAVVAEKVRGLHFGTVQITVHDSRVVQIERIERTRIEVSRSA